MKNFIFSFLALAFCSQVISQHESFPFDENGLCTQSIQAVTYLNPEMKEGAEWIPVGPFGGDVVDIAIDPTNTTHTYLAAGYPYHRTSNTDSWEIITPLLNLSPSGIYCIEANDVGTIYAGGSATYGKIFKSIDQGETWQQKFITVSGGALNITIDPSNQDNIYVVTTSNLSGSVNKVITKSTDGGDSWTPLDMTSIFPNGMGCNDLALDPDDNDILVALGDGGFSFPPKAIISIDGGNSWNDITAGLPSGKPFNEVTIQNSSIYISGGQLFGGNTMGIYKSTDLGSSWEDISIGFPIKVVNDILIDPDDATIMYAATEGDGIYKSIDAGESWSFETTGAGDNGSARKIIFNPENSSMLFSGFLSLGVCSSDDGGESWSSASIGISSLKLNGIEIDPSGPDMILASFEAENSGGCYLFDPNDGDWSLVSSLPATRFSAVSIGIDGRMYTWSNGPTTVAAEGLYRSSDDGETWENMGPNIGPVFETQIYALALSDTDPDLIFIGGNNFGVNGWESMIYKSEDAGETWENVFMGPENDKFKYIFIDPTSEDQVVYAAYQTETDGAGFIKSIDAGTNWLPINTGIPESAKWAGAIICDPNDPDILYGGIGGYGGTAGKVYLSENGGSSWEAMNISLSNYSKITDLIISPVSEEVVYAATTLNGVMITLDADSWQSANEGLLASNITGFSRPFYNDLEEPGFYASTFSHSAFYTLAFDPGTIGVHEKGGSNNDIQIFPNPSSGSFSVDMGLNSIEETTISIYGVTGVRIGSIRIEASNSTIIPVEMELETGTYFIIINSGNVSVSKKVMIN